MFDVKADKAAKEEECWQKESNDAKLRQYHLLQTGYSTMQLTPSPPAGLSGHSSFGMSPQQAMALNFSPCPMRMPVPVLRMYQIKTANQLMKLCMWSVQ